MTTEYCAGGILTGVENTVRNNHVSAVESANYFLVVRVCTLPLKCCSEIFQWSMQVMSLDMPVDREAF